jgi:hypothetical protein
MKSARMSTADFPNGMGGRSSSAIWEAARCFARRCSFHLTRLSIQTIRRTVRVEHAPLKLDPLFVFGLLNDVILQRLGTKGTRSTVLIVIDDRRYLAIAAYMLLGGIPGSITSINGKHKRDLARG